APFCHFLFFFSSRSRHTICLSDWSSVVCSSDLLMSSTVSAVFTFAPTGAGLPVGANVNTALTVEDIKRIIAEAQSSGADSVGLRSEERRVGKEFSVRWMT